MLCRDVLFLRPAEGTARIVRSSTNSVEPSGQQVERRAVSLLGHERSSLYYSGGHHLVGDGDTLFLKAQDQVSEEDFTMPMQSPGYIKL